MSVPSPTSRNHNFESGSISSDAAASPLPKKVAKGKEHIDVEHATSSVRENIDTPQPKFKSYIYSTKSTSFLKHLPGVKFFLFCVDSIKKALFYPEVKVWAPKANLNEKQQQQVNQSLLDAVESNSYSGVVKALQQGADPNCNSKAGAPALALAVHSENEEIIKLLMSKGAKITTPNGMNIISYAYAQGYESLARMMYKNDPELGEYAHDVRMLVHRFALKKVAKDLSFEGYVKEITGQEFSRSAHNFFSDDNNSSASNIDKDKVLRSIDKAASVNKALALVDRGEIVGIQTKFTPDDKNLSGGHVVIASVFKAGDDYIFVKGNRGMGINANNALEFFKITKPENIDEAVRALRFIEENPKARGESYFLKGINQDLGLVPYPNSKENVIRHKIQSIGNCSWASTKLLMEIITYANLRQNGVFHTEAVRIAHEIYKDFTSFDRKTAINEFLNFVSLNKDKLSDEKLRAQGLPTVTELVLDLISDISFAKDPESIKKLLAHLKSTHTGFAEELFKSKLFTQPNLDAEEFEPFLKFMSAIPEIESDPILKGKTIEIVLRSILNLNMKSLEDFPQILVTIAQHPELAQSKLIKPLMKAVADPLFWDKSDPKTVLGVVNLIKGIKPSNEIVKKFIDDFQVILHEKIQQKGPEFHLIFQDGIKGA